MQAAQSVFTAPWPKTITPLDTCGLVRLQGELFAEVCACGDLLTAAVIENYRIWLTAQGQNDSPTGSSILFDTVAVHLAHSRQYLRMEELGIRVTDDGFIVEDADAPQVECAVAWEDYAGYQRSLVHTLTGG
ncbi:MAG TPA: hypothetical protein VGL77_04280 [Armatimonadota bacterium]